MNKHERIKRINTDDISRHELIMYVDEAEATEKKLEKFKETFNAYDLKTRQGYVAYEILQEYKTNIDKIFDKYGLLREKENKTEYEKGILRGFHIALNMLGYGDE